MEAGDKLTLVFFETHLAQEGALPQQRHNIEQINLVVDAPIRLFMLRELVLLGEEPRRVFLTAAEILYQREAERVQVLDVVPRPGYQLLPQIIILRVFLQGLVVQSWNVGRVGVKCLDEGLFEAKLLVASDEKLNHRE